MTASTVPAPTATEQPKIFSFSALIAAIGRCFRGFGPLFVIVIVNALIQALLVGMFNPIPGFSFSFLLLALISFIVLIESFYAINVMSLNAATGKPRLANYLDRTGKAHLRFAGWSVLTYVLVMVGLMISTWLGLLVLAVLAYVPVIATDTGRNPLLTNFKTIGSRPIRWVVTMFFTGILLVVSVVLSGIGGFFIGGAGHPLAGFINSMIAWICWGVVAAWFTSALALIYRSTRAGALPENQSAGA